MSAVIGALRADLSANTAKWEEGFKKAQETTRKFGQEIKKQQAGIEAETAKIGAAMNRMSNGIRTMLLGAVAGVSVGKLAQLTREAMQFAEGIERQSRALGVGVERLQEWEYGARQAGMETGKLGPMLEQMQGKLAEAASGKGEGLPIFKQLGLQLSDANGELKKLEDQLPAIADQMSRLSKGDQLVFAKALGIEGGAAEFIRFTEGGAAGLRKIQEEARRAGVVLDVDGVKRLAEMNRQFDNLAKQIDTELKQALVDLGPVLLKLLGFASDIAGVFTRILRELGIASSSLSQRMLDNARDMQALEAAKKNRLPGDAPDSTYDSEMARLRAEREALLEEKVAEGYGDIKPAPPKTGRRLNGAPAGSESELSRVLRSIREEADIARKALTQGPDAAAWQKYADDLERIPGGAAKMTEAMQVFYRGWDDKGKKTLQDFARETDHSRRVAEAEATGRRDLVAVLELEFRMRQQYGDRVVDMNRKQIEAAALQRYQLEENRRLMQAGMQELEAVGRMAFEGMGEALWNWGDANESLAERMKKVWADVFKYLAQKIFELGVINPLMNALNPGGQQKDTLGGILGAVFSGIAGAAGGAAGGGGMGASLGGFRAAGGPVSAGTTYMVGEMGPELFRPNTSGMIVPNDEIGGGPVNIIVSGNNGDAAVEAAVMKGIARAAPYIEGRAVNQVRDRAFRDPQFLPGR